MKLKKNLIKLKGDASDRIFFREKRNKLSSIFIYAKKNKKSNLLTYDAINKILLKNKVLAPLLLSENYKNNFIEIEDFGNQTIFNLLKKNKVDKLMIFKKIIKLLNRIQSIQQKSVKNFKNKNYHIPVYSSQILFNETNLFSEWYAKKDYQIQNIFF